MNEHIKSFLNEEQDPKAIEKITAKLSDLLMRNEEIGYIGVQKKPAINVFPDSIVLTNKRIILCKPKNLGLSMDFTDYAWEDVAATFVKENILGSEFSFSTKTDLTISMDYLPKAQARKIFTYAKEQVESAKQGIRFQSAEVLEEKEPGVFASSDASPIEPTIEIAETEEVTNFAEILPVMQSGYRPEKQFPDEIPESMQEKSLSELSSEELFEKLQNYKKLLDNGLIVQSEYDALKKQILGYL
ncbi:MAG TPA: PH domain-containing protein [Flavobacterium sp.]|jgi:hypothetical protein